MLGSDDEYIAEYFMGFLELLAVLQRAQMKQLAQSSWLKPRVKVLASEDLSPFCPSCSANRTAACSTDEAVGCRHRGPGRL